MGQLTCMYLLRTYLQRFSYYQLRRLRAIRKSVSTSTMTTIIVHTFFCPIIDYCNSLIGLPKVRLSPIQSLLNAAARLMLAFLKFSHIFFFMINQLNWLPLSARLEFKILVLVLKSKLGFAPKISYGSHSLHFTFNFTSTTPLPRLAGSFCFAS